MPILASPSAPVGWAAGGGGDLAQLRHDRAGVASSDRRSSRRPGLDGEVGHHRSQVVDRREPGGVHHRDMSHGPDAPDHSAFSMIIVPTDTPASTIVQETRCWASVGALRGGYDTCGSAITCWGARPRRDPGASAPAGSSMPCAGSVRPAAFDLLCERLVSREAFGSSLASSADAAARLRQLRLDPGLRP